MPTIVVSSQKQNDVDKKRKLVERITSAVVEVYGVPKEAITVVLLENEPENVGVGGVLLLDRQRQAGR